MSNALLQDGGGHDPKRRRLTQIREPPDHDINCAFGHDCVTGPWYGFGSGNMRKVAWTGVHVGHMSIPEGMHPACRAMTDRPARMMGLAEYGLAVCRDTTCILLQAADPWEAMQLRAQRLPCVRRGRIIA